MEDSNKIGHKYTEEFKCRVRQFFYENNKDLNKTLQWVREEFYPSIARKIVHTWVDKKYAEHVRTVRDRNNKKWRERYPDKYKTISKNNQIDQLTRHKSKRYEMTKKWRESNKEHLQEYHKKRWQLNKEKELERKRLRKQTDPEYKLLENMRTYIWQQLKKAFSSAKKKYIKEQTSCELLGCTPAEYLNHLRTLYKPGMCDENYGEWHVDHIVPCAAFDLTDIEQAKKCFHYTNLQPLWAHENLSKSNKYEQTNVH